MHQICAVEHIFDFTQVWDILISTVEQQRFADVETGRKVMDVLESQRLLLTG